VDVALEVVDLLTAGERDRDQADVPALADAEAGIAEEIADDCAYAGRVNDDFEAVVLEDRIVRESLHALDDLGVRRAERDALKVMDDDARGGFGREGDEAAPGGFDAALGDGGGGEVAGLAEVKAKVEPGLLSCSLCFPFWFLAD